MTIEKRKLPAEYKWLEKEQGLLLTPKALEIYGTLEVKGPGNNPEILAWADEIGGWIGGFYDKDEIPWCGLFMAIVVKRAGLPFSQKALSAKEWGAWGRPVLQPGLDDVLVFTRTGGGHVGLYVGEDRDCYHVLGGNQADSVSIARLAKDRLWQVRSAPGGKSGRTVRLAATGKVSEDEA